MLSVNRIISIFITLNIHSFTSTHAIGQELARCEATTKKKNEKSRTDEMMTKRINGENCQENDLMAGSAFVLLTRL